MKLSKLGLGLLLIVTMSACTTPEPGVYRGGVLIKEGPLDIQEQDSFRFVEKWRISHSWLSGPTAIWPCKYGGNAFSSRAEWKALGSESDSPIYEINNRLFSIGTSYKTHRLELYHLSNESIYGTNGEGKFEGYSAFCSHVFKDTYDGIGLYIVKPDPAKGTDEWIKGAQSVTINGLHWLRKIEPLRDWSNSRERLAAPIETWVLQIPDTPYWLKLHLSSSSGATSKYHAGALAYPEKHQRIVDLFHQIVYSVKLEPIMPIDISPLVKEIR